MSFPNRRVGFQPQVPVRKVGRGPNTAANVMSVKRLEVVWMAGWFRRQIHVATARV